MGADILLNLSFALTPVLVESLSSCERKTARQDSRGAGHGNRDEATDSRRLGAQQQLRAQLNEGTMMKKDARMDDGLDERQNAGNERREKAVTR